MKIEFIPCSKDAELLVPHPKPSKNFIPEWYKNVPPPPKKLFFKNPGDVDNLNIKSCVPFLDAFSHGYIQETWTDIYIESDSENIINYNWSSGPDIISHRTNLSNFSIDKNIFYPQELLWREQWVPKCPKGYSVLYTSPLNMFNLPFRSLDAIIDSDSYYHEYSGQYPFYVNKGFSGIIPAGTPMYQIIIIKRNSWRSFISKYNYEINKKRNHEIRKYIHGGYKKFFWQKKSFH